MKQVLSTGKIRSPHGVKGFVKVSPYGNNCEHFFSLKEVTLMKLGRTKDVEIEKVQKFGSELLVKFVGINTPEDAKFLSGWDILVPRNQASKLEKDEVYIADLIGMKLVYDKEEVGKVLSVCEGAQSYLLEVECKDSKVRFVPYLKGIFVEPADLNTDTIKLLNKELVQ